MTAAAVVALELVHHNIGETGVADRGLPQGLHAVHGARGQRGQPARLIRYGPDDQPVEVRQLLAVDRHPVVRIPHEDRLVVDVAGLQDERPGPDRVQGVSVRVADCHTRVEHHSEGLEGQLTIEGHVGGTQGVLDREVTNGLDAHEPGPSDRSGGNRPGLLDREHVRDRLGGQCVSIAERDPRSQHHCPDGVVAVRGDALSRPRRVGTGVGLLHESLMDRSHEDQARRRAGVLPGTQSGRFGFDTDGHLAAMHGHRCRDDEVAFAEA